MLLLWGNTGATHYRQLQWFQDKNQHQLMQCSHIILLLFNTCCSSSFSVVIESSGIYVLCFCSMLVV